MKNKFYNYCILLFLIIVMITIAAKNIIGNYISEKMAIFFYISLVILIIFFVREFFTKLSPEFNRRKLINYLVFFVLIFGILSTFDGLSSEYLNFIRNNRTNYNSKQRGGAEIVSESKEEKITIESNAIDAYIEKKVDIDITDELFVATLNDAYMSIESYVGKKIKMSGIIFKDQYMKNTEYGIGKYYMSCCAIDMNLIGFVFDLEKNIDEKFVPEQDATYEITAMVSMHKYSINGKEIDEPILKIIDAKKVENPSNNVVY